MFKWLIGRSKLGQASPLEEMSEVERFQNTLEFARKLHSENPLALQTLIDSIVQKLQLERLHHTISHPTHQGCSTIASVAALFFGFEGWRSIPSEYLDHLKPRDCQNVIELRHTQVITTPWHKERLINTMASLGAPGGEEWRFDPINHKVILLKPLNIGVAFSGNHSITAGLLHKQGSVQVMGFVDTRELLKTLYCDGEFWRSPSHESPMNSYEGGLLYELCRLI